jgi:hypothetical protein
MDEVAYSCSRFLPDDMTWVQYIAPVADATMADNVLGLYTMALYFSIMTLTTVGYGDMHAYTFEEHWVVIGMMLVGGVIWAYLIGVLTGIVTSLDVRGTTYKQVHQRKNQFRVVEHGETSFASLQVMDELNYMVEDQSIPQNLAVRVRNYWTETQHLLRLKDYDELCDRLSPKLQGEIAFFTGA